jgi:hypothetical protein
MIDSGAGSQTEAWEEHKFLAEMVLDICNDRLSNDE